MSQQQPPNDLSQLGVEDNDVAIKSEFGDSETRTTGTGSQNHVDETYYHGHAEMNPHFSHGRWHPQISLPSELLESYQPPAHLYIETTPTADPSSFQGLPTEYPDIPSTPDQPEPNLAARANELINERLDRKPSGTSVVDPDSVYHESGRLYHGYKDGKYYLPNDAAEQERLDLQHEMYRLLFDGWLALAPMARPPRYVLDVGTGTGLWAKDFAEQNPSSYVIGSDLSAIQPETTLPNLVWSKDDAEDSWIFPMPRSHLAPEDIKDPEAEAYLIAFDYVHLRLVFSCFNDPKLVIKHAYDNMRPGGWIEYQDLYPDVFQSNPEFKGNALKRWFDGFTRGARAVGRDLRVAIKYKEWLEEAGFVEVQQTRFPLPAHQWSDDPKFKMVGAFNNQNITEGVRGVGWKMLKASGMSADEIEALIAEVLKELRIRSNHIYGHVYVVYGRKPYPNELHATGAHVPIRG